MSFGLVATAIVGSAALGAGASLASADSQRSAANNAADKVGQAGAAANAKLAPFVNTGVAANSRLATLLGIAPSTGVDWNAYLKANPDVAASATYGNNPAQHYEDYGKKEGRSLTYLDPSAVTSNPDYGSLLKSFAPSDLTTDPGYQFGLTQGEKALQRNASANGRYFAPATSEALSKFNNDYATTKFDDAFNRDNTSKQQIYGFLSGTSSAGQNAAAGQANNTLGTANNVAGLTTSGAAAGAAGDVGAANAVSSGVSGGLNYANQSRLLDLITKSRAATTMAAPSAGFAGAM